MRICVLVLVVLELALFPLIQLTRASVSAFSSYLAIAFVALFALVSAFGEKGAGHLIRLGILFTLVADYFLVLSDGAELEGVIAFILVQLSYFAYTLVREDRVSVRRANIFTRIGLCAALIIGAVAVLGKDNDALSIVSVIYYANLLTNIVFAFLLGREARVFAIGLVLFAMCDLCIGLEVLTSTYLDSSVLDFFYGSRLNLPWVFYQPSQVLIGLALYRKDKARDGLN